MASSAHDAAPPATAAEETEQPQEETTTAPTTAAPAAPTSPPATTPPAAAPATAPTVEVGHGTIEVDEGFGASDDEGYSTDSASNASTSLSSSVRNYVFENNRRYHKFKEGHYPIPNDNEEQEREDMKHTLVLHLCGGKLHLCPLDNPQKIIDIGTGTGIWAIDMGDEYPDAEMVHGIDLSPIQPSWIPPNVKFLVDDAEATWLYEANSLDFVHLRHMSIGIKDWPKLLGQAYKALKPGGWVELQDMHFITHSDDDTIPANYQYDEFIRLFNEGIKPMGFDLHGVLKNEENVEGAGFTNITHRKFKVPIGPWPKDPSLKTCGLYNRTCTLGVLRAAVAPFTRGLKWSPEEVEVFLIGVRRDLMNSNIHSYFTLDIVYGQKPLDAT